MNTQKYGIVFGLDQETEDLAASLSYRLAAMTADGDPLLRVREEQYGARTAHLTNFHCVGNENLAQEMQDMVLSIAAASAKGGPGRTSIRFKACAVNAGGWGFWEPDGKVPGSVLDLHRAVLEAWEPVYRERGFGPVPLSWDPPPFMRGSVARYGYPNCGASWKPHVTLNVGFDEEHRGRVIEEAGHLAIVDRLIVARIGDHGRIAEIREIFDL